MYHRATQISLSIDRVSNYFSYLIVHRSENITESEGKKLREKKKKIIR